MYDYDLIVVGCGASSYGFLKGLEKNKDFKDKKIAVLCPSEYKQNTVKCNIKGISPKFLQDKNLLSLSYYLDTFVNVIQKTNLASVMLRLRNFYLLVGMSKMIFRIILT